jgi:hypothetical protein
VFDGREKSGELVAGQLVGTIRGVEKGDVGLTQGVLLDEEYDGEDFDEKELSP